MEAVQCQISQCRHQISQAEVDQADINNRIFNNKVIGVLHKLVERTVVITLQVEVTMEVAININLAAEAVAGLAEIIVRFIN